MGGAADSFQTRRRRDNGEVQRVGDGWACRIACSIEIATCCSVYVFKLLIKTILAITEFYCKFLLIYMPSLVVCKTILFKCSFIN